MANPIFAPADMLSLFVDALDSIRDLAVEAANGQPDSGLHHVNADHFASLLGILIDGMRSELERLSPTA